MDNDNNKEPILLGTLKKQKASKPIFVFFVFLILIGVSFSLPYIKDYLSSSDNEFIKVINKYIGNETETNVPEEKEPEIIVYPLTNESSIAFENLRISKFNISDRIIYYSIYATAEEINLDTETIYLEIYNSSKDLITRVKLVNIINIEEQKMSSIIPIFSFDSAGIYFGKVVRLSENTYPSVNIKENILTCELNNNKYIYSFNNNALTQIENNYKNTNINDLENYMKDFNYYQEKANLINNILDSSASAQEVELGFEFNATINLIDFNQLSLKGYEDYNYYMLNTNPKIINYELTSKGFVCK